MKFLIGFCLVMIIICVILSLIVINQVKKIKSLKKTMETVIQANDNLHEELKKIYEMDKIKSDNRRESDEKINELHNGDATSNAINILCNNKNK